VVVYAGERAEEVRDIIKSDVYAKSGVWDLEKIEIIPVRGFPKCHCFTTGLDYV
jgi:hypothetical protein